jgi:hypothetical protein
MLHKKIFWFWWRKKKYSDSEFLSYNLMLNSGKKIRAWRDKKKIIPTLVLSEKKILNDTKNHNTPFKLNGWSLSILLYNNFSFLQHIFCTLLQMMRVMSLFIYAAWFEFPLMIYLPVFVHRCKKQNKICSILEIQSNLY